MTFGKYRNRRVEDVPIDYLEWCWENVEWRSASLENSVRKRLESSGYFGSTEPKPSYPPAADVNQIVVRWHRQLCVRHHPDRGGNCEIMAAINDAKDQLVEMLEAVAG